MVMTTAEFRDHLATQLGVKGRGNTLSSDDANYLETTIANCHEELEELEAALWDVDSIPAAAVNGFTIYCRGAISRFGFEMNPGLQEVGLKMLRTVFADTRNSVGRANYF